MKYISLFAGIGGFDLSLNRLGHECVYVNEWDKYAAQTYEKNFKHKVDTRSITDVQTSEIPDHDLLVGGFPCQAFSIAGKRRGFDETRGTLFFDIARILKEKRTRYFILENVKGLLSHDNGNTFKTIISTLVELGYDLQWQVLNSKNFGVPQNRERVFIVGHLRGQPRPQVFPFGERNERTDGSDAKAPQTQITNTIDTRTGSYPKWGQYINVVGSLNDEKWRKFNESSRRVYGTDGIAPTVPTSAGGGHTPKIINPLKGKTDYGWHFEQGVYDENGIVRSLKAGEGSGNKAKVVSNMRIRRLTPIECERLQGFPDNWTQGVSDTQRYKQLGNAVTVNVVYEVAKRL